jgi:uncharacterized membrane protein
MTALNRWKIGTDMVISASAFAAVAAAFLASLVEVTEAYTIVLAVGLSKGWRSAIVGAFFGLIALLPIVLILGPLLDQVPLAYIQFPIGVLILLVGLGWLRKAILRAAGVIPLHDEDAILGETLNTLGPRALTSGLSPVGIMTAFQGVLLEGVEVVFIVVAVGTGRHLLMAASLGAGAACLLVVMVGALVHKPLSQVPENSLKFVVGVMLTSFGVFWLGEALSVPWPGRDLALLYLATIFLATGLANVTLIRRNHARVA